MAENHILESDGYEDEVDLGEEDDRFLGLLRRDAKERATWMEQFGKSVKNWVSRPDDKIAQGLLSAHLPTALRLSINAPFQDIRSNMTALLGEVERLGHPIPSLMFDGPSSFIPKAVTVCYDNPSEAYREAVSSVQSLYEESFLHEGRLSHAVLLLGYHPSYLNNFIKTHDLLMHGDGPLPLPLRNYLAILAASRHKCSYLVTIQEAAFLKNGGDVTWLQGVQHLPRKMFNLLTINKLLAHQPWFVRPEHMKDLLRGADSWSVAELVHALVIMAHFHSLASFALGCGINPEIDTPLGHSLLLDEDNSVPRPPFCTNPALGIGMPTPASSEAGSEPISPIQSPTDHPRPLQSLIVQHFIDSQNTDEPGSEDKQLADTLKERLKTIQNDSSSDEESLEQNNDIQFASASSAEPSHKPKDPIPIPISLIKYLEDPSFEHEDFTLSSAITLRARDYSWEDHGFPFLNSLYPDIGPLLDEKFKLAFQMTYRTVGAAKDIDTSSFRQAIWYYIHSIKGIRHDDYHYRRVNQVLDIKFKTFIRIVACFPEKVINFDFTNTMSGLEYSEKVHVNLLVLEARLQAELIYALRAIMTYMK